MPIRWTGILMTSNFLLDIFISKIFQSFSSSSPSNPSKFSAQLSGHYQRLLMYFSLPVIRKIAKTINYLEIELYRCKKFYPALLNAGWIVLVMLKKGNVSRRDFILNCIFVIISGFYRVRSTCVTVQFVIRLATVTGAWLAKKMNRIH